MIERTLQPHLLALAGRYPVITLTGPRQSGKTTLCRLAFPDRPYVSLEAPATRELATEDPLGFLASYPGGAVLDEIQRTPQLPSYLQGLVDADPRPGRFILTGSQNLALINAVTQSLAGRTALVELLPLGLDEVRRFPHPPSGLYPTLWTGGYPRILEQDLPAAEWLANYTATYVERDVRQVLNVGNLVQFQTFLRLCAGRTGQLLNLSSLAADCGLSTATARSWLSVLEASYLLFRLPPLHSNLGKRLVKAPKLYFYDTGLVCSLLGIEEPQQLETHPLRGAIFETWVVAEITKQHLHRGQRPRLYFYGERGRLEIDLIVERGANLTAIEIKSAQTPAASFFANLEQLERRVAASDAPVRLAKRMVIYGGGESQQRRLGQLLAWSDVPAQDWVSQRPAS